MYRIQIWRIKASYLLVCGLYLFLPARGYSQADCITSFGSVFSTPSGNEQANCLAVTAEKDGVYLAGVKNDSTLIMEVNLAGEVVWSKTMKIITAASEFPTSILVDSDGMLAVAGMAGDITVGGQVYVIRMDPGNQQILWSKEYSNGPTNFSYNLIQKEPNGHYLLNTNPYDYPNSHGDVDIFEINKNTGGVIPAFAMKYTFFGTETLAEIIYHDGYVYGTGRYKDGGSVSDFRHVIVKLDGDNGSQIWSGFGHVPDNMPARLYGNQILIHNDEIITGYVGDPDGTNLPDNEFFVQKTSLDGNLIWCNHYDLTGQSLACHDMLYSENGVVVLASQRTPDQEIILFKIGNDGSVIWARRFLFPLITNLQMTPFGGNRLVAINNELMFIVTGNVDGPDKDIMLVRMDLDGNANMPCVKSENIILPVEQVANASFYTGNPNATANVPIVITHTISPLDGFVTPDEACFIPDTIFTVIDTSICLGHSYEGYNQAGIYTDPFLSVEGCDSIRTLNLEVLPVLETFVNAIVCEGIIVHGYSETGYYVDTFTSVTGCDSLSILDLTVHDTIMRFHNHQICNGDQYMGYTTAGIYTDTFQTYQGCDSIIELSLEVVDEITELISATICLGDNYFGYSQSGIYTDTAVTAFGCDSISILELNVVAEEKDVAISICEGEIFESYSVPGSYIDTLPGIASPCDTIRYLSLSVIAPVATQISDVICEGDDYFGHTLPGIYTDTLRSVFGCDSVRTISLALLPATYSHTETSLCAGTSFGYTQPGLYIDTLVSHNGCDSIRTLVLESEPIYMPNVISPNGDEINDEFRIYTPGNQPLDVAYFAIFDRLGNMIYETFTWPVVWDGKDNHAEPFNPGVFTYVLSYYCNLQRLTLTGNITLIR